MTKSQSTKGADHGEWSRVTEVKSELGSATKSKTTTTRISQHVSAEIRGQQSDYLLAGIAETFFTMNETVLPEAPSRVKCIITQSWSTYWHVDGCPFTLTLFNAEDQPLLIVPLSPISGGNNNSDNNGNPKTISTPVDVEDLGIFTTATYGIFKVDSGHFFGN